MPNFQHFTLFTLRFWPLLFVVGCLDEIKLAPPDGAETSLLVQGSLIAGNPSVVKVVVQQLDFFDNNTVKAIDGAKVWLSDDAGRRRQLQSLNSGGNYRLEIPAHDPDFPVVVGQKFHIEVAMPNGQQYVSAPEPLLPALRPDSVHFQLVEREVADPIKQFIRVPFVQFGLDTRLDLPQNAGRARLRWELGQAYKLTDTPGKLCYCTRALLSDNVHIFDGPAATTDRLQNFTLVEAKVDYPFAEGFYLIVYQQSISENALGYFTELRQLLDKKGTLFDPPAGVIRTNITCTNAPENVAHGFFYVASQDTIRQYVSPGESGNYSLKCPPPPSNGEAPRPNSCDDCLLEPGGSTQKPVWWKK